MNKRRVLWLVAESLIFLVAIRLIFNPRPLVYVLSFPYGFLAGSAASQAVWIKIRGHFRFHKRAVAGASGEMQ